MRVLRLRVPSAVAEGRRWPGAGAAAADVGAELGRERAPMTAACMPRSPAAIAEAVALVDPERNVELQPGGGLTWCNKFIKLVTALLECAVPFLLANDQLDWLAGDAGAAHGWRAVTPQEAMADAAKGCPVIVGWKNPDPKGHGHIALVRAPPPGRSGVWISQAGAHNYELAPLINGFGNHAPLVWFAHA